jgi:restriction system protein
VNAESHKVHSQRLPPYSAVRKVLSISQGIRADTVTSMSKAIWKHVGTPQNPVDWSQPDTWIPARLSGEHADLAQLIWAQTGHSVNPRYVYNTYLFINRYKLLVPDEAGKYQLTARGEAFLHEDIHLLRELDDAEGLLQVLTILALRPDAAIGDLLPDWENFLAEYSNYRTKLTIAYTLRRRLKNLVERGLVTHKDGTYSISDAGLDYITTYSPSGVRLPDPRRDMLHSIEAFNAIQLDNLRERLSKMHPYRFEYLIRQLLEAMGYEDVKVTRESGDKGVDVIATVQVGITTITEYVQVKRQQSNVGRPVLDQLRGALPLHNALRGTIITLGDFSKGCTDVALHPGALPITLINGDRLLKMLRDHEIGIRRSPVPLYEVDTVFFEQSLNELNEDNFGSE